jgi:hypothetical protein
MSAQESSVPKNEVHPQIERLHVMISEWDVFDVYEGNWEGDALVVNNLRSATTFRFGGQEFYSQMTWCEITANGFIMESHLSADEGKSWFTQAKSRYMRHG